MAPKSWTIIDVQRNQHLDELSVSAADVPGSAQGYAIAKQTLRGGLREGVDSIRIDNGTFSFVALPTRGMGLWKAWLGDTEIGWKSPVRGPVHPKFVPLTEPSGLGWLDGFDELLVRCGLESNGAPGFDEQGRLKYPLHGRIGNRPAHKVRLDVDGQTGEISLIGEVEETRFHFQKLRMTSKLSTVVGQPGLSIHDEVHNLSDSHAEIQILYHFNFGDPLLDAGSQFVAPLKTVVPRNQRAAEGIKNWASYAAPEANFEEQVYFLELLSQSSGDSHVLLKNAHSTQGVSMYFNTQRLPCFTVWKNTTSLSDGYVTGLEPGTNFPNPREYEGQQKRVVQLSPGGKISFEVRLEVHNTAAEVAAAESAIAQIQGDTQPGIYDQPQQGWCEGA